MQYYPTEFPDFGPDVEIRQIPDFPNYWITNYGDVWSYATRTAKELAKSFKVSISTIFKIRVGKR